MQGPPASIPSKHFADTTPTAYAIGVKPPNIGKAGVSAAFAARAAAAADGGGRGYAFRYSSPM
eukprot:1177541-Prorocentrum_minimum.AAC.1